MIFKSPTIIPFILAGFLIVCFMMPKAQASYNTVPLYSHWGIHQTAPMPVIDVKGADRYISDGDYKPSPQDYTLYDTLEVDSPSVTRTFFIFNSGDADLELGTITSSNQQEFEIIYQSDTTTLNPGDSVSFQVQFTALHDGYISSDIIIPNNVSDEGVFTFTVAGVGVGEFEILVKGENLLIDIGDDTPSPSDGTDFGLVEVPSGVSKSTFWILNLSNVDILIPGITISDTANFFLTVLPPTAIARDDSASFTVTFDPAFHGPIEATVAVENSTPHKSPYLFDILGEGLDFSKILVQGNQQWIHYGDMTPDTVDLTTFGKTSIYTGEETHTFMIINGSTVGLDLTGDIMTSNQTFRITQPESLYLAAGDTTTFDITFDPESLGDTTALVFIPNTDTDQNPFVFMVKGTGSDHIDFPTGNTGGNGGQTFIEVKGNQQIIPNGNLLTSEEDSTNFGKVNIDIGRVARTFWILNQGTDTLHLTEDIMTNLETFEIIQPVSWKVAPRDSVSFKITFDPEEMGWESGFTVISSDDPGNPSYIFAIKGRGTEFIETTIRGNQQIIASGDSVPSLADFTDFDSLYVNKGPADRTHTFWIYNTGIDSLFLHLPIVSSIEQFAITQPAISQLAAGDSISFKVTFVSEISGDFQGTVYVFNDDPAHNPYYFGVSGTFSTYINGFPVATDDQYRIEKNTTLNASVFSGSGEDTLSINSPNTFYLEEEASNGHLMFNPDGSFQYDPYKNFWGTDTFSYSLCDVENDCAIATVTIHVNGAGIDIYNAFSPDDDGINDTWEIDNITNYHSNTVTIFNRWGSKVWEAHNYNNQDIIWKGTAENGSKLPDGTYYYLITVEELGKQQGYVVISRQR